MTSLFIVLIIGCGLAVAIALIRGLGAFYKDAERIKAGDPEAIMLHGKQQNRMMSQRVLFQGIAIALVVMLGALASR